MKNKVKVKGCRNSVNDGTSIEPSSPTPIGTRGNPSPHCKQSSLNGVVPGFISFNPEYLDMIRTGG